MTTEFQNSLAGPAGLSRRAVLAGLAALLSLPGKALAAPTTSWTVATQIIAGTRVADPTVLALAVNAIASEFSEATTEDLLRAVLARDAANIAEPFTDPAVEAAARRFVEIVYTGAIGASATPGFHQALAWQVLPFTKPPSICGKGFGWWTHPPDERGGS